MLAQVMMRTTKATAASQSAIVPSSSRSAPLDSIPMVRSGSTTMLLASRSRSPGVASW